MGFMNRLTEGQVGCIDGESVVTAREKKRLSDGILWQGRRTEVEDISGTPEGVP